MAAWASFVSLPESVDDERTYTRNDIDFEGAAHIRGDPALGYARGIVSSNRHNGSMVARPKRELAREHLNLALEELEEENLGLVATLLLHSAEAAIDALADETGISTSPHHWRRGEIVDELEKKGVLESDGGADLVRVLNEDRKAYAYDGEEPTFGGDDAEEIVARVVELVEAAEAAGAR